MIMKPSNTSRRKFIQSTAAAGFLAGGFPVIAQAGTRKLKVGLIGCGGRNMGAIENFLEAAKTIGDVEVEVVAVTDPQKDRAEGAGRRFNLSAGSVFTQFDGFRKVIDSGVDVVLIATPPNFRPAHVEYAVQAGKHVFTEKPVAVDPPGIRRFIAAAEEATKKGLSIVAGTQRRYDAGYNRNAQAIRDGAIGRILGGTIHWCQNQLWFKRREEGESDALYLARNWVNFCEMSGDHIVEQHVHNIDVAIWFLGRVPRTATGFGSRERRVTGNQYDFFSVDYDFGDDVHIHSMCRQINGTYSRVGELFVATDGTCAGGGKIVSHSGKPIPPAPEGWHQNPYVQEHVALIQSIFSGKPINEGRQVAESCMAAIMGRISAYTGQMVRWREVMEDQASPHYNLTLSPTPEDFENGNVVCPQEETAPVPGQ